ncbi:MAG: hypothetical protein HZA50_07210 [Planctomycetes bacterium]|nr:hypothetical protein [Planctomycetota bacterium]
MNSAERLRAIFDGGTPDRFGISTYELVGWDSDAWENKMPAYARLMEKIRRDTDCMYRAGVSVPNVAEAPVTNRKWTEDGHAFSENIFHTARGDLRQLLRNDPGLHTTWQIEHICKSLDDVEVWLDLPWSPGEPDGSKMRLAWQRLQGKYGIPKFSTSDPICVFIDLMEFGEFTIAAITERERVLKAMDRIHERQMETLRRIVSLPEVKGTQCRICGPEAATPPYLPPEMFDDFVARYLRKMIEVLRGAGVFVRVHCHGKMGKVVDRIVDSGAQGIDPCEPPPDGDITLKELRRRFPKLVLFGNMEIKELEHSSPQRVRELTRQAISEAAGGPFVLLPTAAPINDDLSAKTEENYFVMIDAALECAGGRTY